MSAVCLTHALHVFKDFRKGYHTLWRAGEKAMTESMPVLMVVPADFPAQHSHLPAFLCMATVELCGEFISVHVQECFLCGVVGFSC